MNPLWMYEEEVGVTVQQTRATKRNIRSLIHQRTNFECDFNFRWERLGAPPAHPRLASPLSFSFLPTRRGHLSGPGQRTPPACSQMHGAGNKINLVAIVFPPV